ncbi:hypothetical protein AMAG_13471 [Allomyces macrogynus ATCC 38327]|uniref:Uncharacterized protein n=1 Tax=Allomyces macrogynus (strain ATCC 38327) TaxID=578462 RepID=A0A0L0T1V8_ALLM3|nr:hypothetical protein AMAG_13471 [Allomyces macrogynus ATCC 38327]|eukprot:KNE68833.1 hypothetical protein AMAG_13471 [Allomyces macrogynus ATCC 38327]
MAPWPSPSNTPDTASTPVAVPIAAPTPSPTEGVHWVVDFSTTGDALTLVTLILQCLAFLMLVWAVTLVVPSMRRNSSKFWKASLVGTVLLVPVPLFEVAFTLSMWSAQSLWPFPPYVTLIGDVLVRAGYGVITVCRFWRLKLITPEHPARATMLFRCASALILVVTLASLGSSFALRLTEWTHRAYGVNIHATTPDPEVIARRNDDRLVGFITFMAVHLANLVTDILFFKTILSSMSATRMTSRDWIALSLPYAAPVAATAAYVVVLVVSFVKPDTPYVIFFSIALNRLAPAIETFLFFRFSVAHTRRLLQAGESSGGHHGARTMAVSGAVGSKPMSASAASRAPVSTASGSWPSKSDLPMAPATKRDQLALDMRVSPPIQWLATGSSTASPTTPGSAGGAAAPWSPAFAPAAEGEHQQGARTRW